MTIRKVISIGDESHALSDAFLSQVLETAVEGACSYWADVHAENAGSDELGADGVRDFGLPEYLEDENDEDDGGTAADDEDAPFYTAATFYAAKNPDQGGTLDLEGLADAIERIAGQEVEVAPAIREIIVAAIEEDDASEIDSEAADCIVQIGLFDEIVFG